MRLRQEAAAATISLVEAARRLRVPYTVAYRLALSGEFRVQRIGSRWMVRVAEVKRWEKKRRGHERAS